MTSKDELCSKKEGNVFCLFTSRFMQWLPEYAPGAGFCLKPGFALDGLDKISRIFHKQKGTPITWLIDHTASEKYGSLFHNWCGEYGDEIAVFVDQLAGRSFLSALNIEDKGFLLNDYFEAERVKIVTYLKNIVEEKVGMPVMVAASYCFDDVTVRALAEAEFIAMWGYAWHQKAIDGVTHRGSLWYPFYINPTNPKFPNQKEGGLLSLFWHHNDLLNVYYASRNNWLASANFAPQPGENVRAGFDKNGTKHVKKTIEEWYAQRRYNDFVALTAMLECEWVDESDVFGTNESAVKHQVEATNVFAQYLASVQEHPDIEITTLGKFAQWYKEKFTTTPEEVFYYRDVIPEYRGWGKERPYPDTIFYGSQRRRMIFTKGLGRIPVEIKDYTLEEKIALSDEVPDAPQPLIDFPMMNDFVSLSFGIHISKEKAVWKAELEIASDRDFKDYGLVLWELNLPLNLNISGIEANSEIKKSTFFPEHDSALLILDLVKGKQRIALEAEVPYLSLTWQNVKEKKTIVIKVVNTGIPVKLARLQAEIGKGFEIESVVYNNVILPDNFKWYSSALDVLSLGVGTLVLRAPYPEVFNINRGENIFYVKYK